MRTLAPASLILLAATTTVAQTPPNLIGPTLNTPLIVQIDHGTCTPLGTCGPVGLPLTTIPLWAAGSAWDSANSALWVTTGQMLGRYGMNGCTLQCGPIACPKNSPTAEASGLDLHDAANQLWIIDTDGWITWCTNACPPVVINSCFTGLASTPVWATTGITIDELRGLVFYSTADFSLGTGSIYVAPLSSPCAWFQVVPVSTCFATQGLITGLAVDAANSVLYWTDGRGTYDWAYTWNGTSVTFTPGTCCIQVAPLTNPLTDLSIRWGGASSTGMSCTSPGCNACPMIHLLRNAPLLGTTLQLGLDLAPINALTLCAVDFGSCSNTGPLIPPFCGPVLIPLTPAMLPLGPNLQTGSGACGSTTFLLPLPSNPIFAGTPLTSQCFGLCIPSGTAVSNCLSWVLQ